MNVRNIRFELGLKVPVRVAHITDPHLTLADERDAGLISHAVGRTEVFWKEAASIGMNAAEAFEKAVESAAKTCDLTVITGDVLDFVSEKNLETSDRILSGKDYLFAAGNHEFCPKVGIPDSFARKRDLWDRIQKHYRGNMGYDHRVVGGVNLVTLDNGFYSFNANQILFLKEQIALKLPIVLFCHVPLSEPILNLTAVHKDLPLDAYQKQINREMLDLIWFSPEIRLIAAGHYHSYAKEVLPCGKTEIITAGTFRGEYTAFEFC